ncbi:MAG: glycosyltransferase family 2 protein [Desulfuromonas sp.]|nr:glycosyltransferase family 2 protein [Desulfuromonas sp.]
MVTAIIVNYFSAEITARAALSIIADAPTAQVFVVDNSNDLHEEQRLSTLLPPSVEYIVTDENLGFGSACNMAFSQAKHEWIFLLNPDAYVLSGCIAAMVAFLESNPKAAAVAPRVFWDAEQNWLLPPAQLPTPANELFMTMGMHWPRLGKYLSNRFRRWALCCNLSTTPTAQQMLSGGNMMLRRSAVEAVGGLFDPDFFMYYEDADLCYRFKKAGFSLYLLSKAHAVHEWCSSSHKEHLSHPSRQRYFNKHFKGHQLRCWQIKLEQSKLPQHLPFSSDLGECCIPFDYSIPDDMQQQWLLELSPHPLFVPALYHYGNGDKCRISDHLWQRLGPGQYWARLSSSSTKSDQYFHWEIKHTR